jgi:hypothetical protein
VISIITAGSCYQPAVMVGDLITTGSCYQPAVMRDITAGPNGHYGPTNSGPGGDEASPTVRNELVVIVRLL